MHSEMLAICGRHFLASYWHQGAAADYTYFLWYLETFVQSIVCCSKKKYKKYMVVTLKKVFGVVFFFFERGKKTKAGFRKSLKCPGKKLWSESAHAQQNVARMWPSFLSSELAAGFLCEIFSCLYCIVLQYRKYDNYRGSFSSFHLQYLSQEKQQSESDKMFYY
jgi:hypothetical protein